MRVMVGVAVGRSVRVGEGVNVGVTEIAADAVCPSSSVKVCRGVGDGDKVRSTSGVRVGASVGERASVTAAVGVCEKN